MVLFQQKNSLWLFKSALGGWWQMSGAIVTDTPPSSSFIWVPSFSSNHPASRLQGWGWWLPADAPGSDMSTGQAEPHVKAQGGSTARSLQSWASFCSFPCTAEGLWVAASQLSYLFSSERKLTSHNIFRAQSVRQPYVSPPNLCILTHTHIIVLFHSCCCLQIYVQVVFAALPADRPWQLPAACWDLCLSCDKYLCFLAASIWCSCLQL